MGTFVTFVIAKGGDQVLRIMLQASDVEGRFQFLRISQTAVPSNARNGWKAVLSRRRRSRAYLGFEVQVVGVEIPNSRERLPVSDNYRAAGPLNKPFSLQRL
jgi:hypothetical protein